MLSRQDFHALKEDDLRVQIVIPLLKAMDYQDVFEYHGGIEEQGKDVVFWKADELGNRRNYAIVLKAGDISGKAQPAKGTAGEVFAQISQCFGSDFLGPKTTESQKVHSCWVVTNGKISKEALKSLKSMLSAHRYEFITTFINGDQLWDLFRKHLKKKLIWNNLAEASQALTSLDTHYKFDTFVSDSKITFALSEKFPGAADEKPLILKTEFRFPDTPDGRRVRDGFERHFTAGYPIDIPSQYIHSIEFPDIIKEIISEEQGMPSLTLGGPVNPRSVEVRFEFTCQTGEHLELDRVNFELKYSGSEEATFESSLNNPPLKLRMVLNSKARTTTINFSSSNTEPINVVQMATRLRFQYCLSQPFKMRVIHVKTEMQLFEVANSTGLGTAPKQLLMDTIDDLASVQRKTGKIINWPGRNFEPGEISAVDLLRKVVRDGRASVSYGDILVGIQRQGMPEILKTFGQGNVANIRLEGQQTINLFDTEIPIGPFRFTGRARLANEDEVFAKYQQPGEAIDTIDIVFVLVDNPSGVNEYLNWLPDAMVS